MRRRTPRWADRRIKPVFGAAEINWDHPFTRGLAGYWLLNHNGTQVDLVTNSQASTISGTPLHGVGPHGQERQYSSDYERDTLVRITGTPFTIWSFSKAVGAAAEYLCGLRGATASYFADIYYNAGSSLRGRVRFFGGFITLSATGAMPANQYTLAALTSRGAADHELYADGVSVQTSASNAGVGFDFPGFVLGSGSNLLASDSSLVYAGVHNRELTADEQVWLRQNPYGFLQPRFSYRSVFVIGGATQTPQALAASIVLIPTLSTLAARLRTLASSVSLVSVMSTVTARLRTLSVSVSLVGTLSAVKSFFKSLTATTALVPALSTAAARVRTLAASVSLVGVISTITARLRTLASTVSLVPVLSTATARLRTLSASITLVPTLGAVKAFFKTLSASVTLVPTLSRVVSRLRTLTASITLVPVLSTITSRLRTLTASITLVPALSAVKSFFKTLTASVALVPSLSTITSRLRTLSSTIVLVPVLSVVSTFRRTLSASVTLVVTLANGAATVFTQTVAAALALVPVLSTASTFRRTLSTSLSFVLRLAKSRFVSTRRPSGGVGYNRRKPGPDPRLHSKRRGWWS